MLGLFASKAYSVINTELLIIIFWVFLIKYVVIGNFDILRKLKILPSSPLIINIEYLNFLFSV